MTDISNAKQNNETLQNFVSDKPLSRSLKRRVITALLALLIALTAAGTATYAWYIYQTNSRTTQVHMAAGSSTKLEIAKAYEGAYSSSIDLGAFEGTLDPVSTDKITNGFQKVFGYTNGSETQPRLIASLFGPAKTSDYFKTSLYIRTNAGKTSVYVSAMDFAKNPDSELLATAIRVGLVVHKPGKDQAVADEYIFELSDQKNPTAEYNTITGQEGWVLDSTRDDGTTVKLDPLTKDNFTSYDSATGVVTKTENAKKLFEIAGDGSGEPGQPVQVDVYIWLEGCDEDCTGYLGSLALRNFAVSFAGYQD